MINKDQPTSTDLMMEFFRDPFNLKIMFLLNDIQPMDLTVIEVSNILKNKQNYNIGLKHVQTCIKKLQKFDVIRVSRKIHGTRVYAFNKESQLATKLFELCETFEDIYSVVMNLPPKPVFVDKKFYAGKEWAKEGHW
jgi:hypothetical protein